MELPCPLRTTRRVLHEKFPHKPYNKSFINQARLVTLAGYWPGSGVYGPLLHLVHKHTQQKELDQYSAILTEQAWSITHVILYCLFG